LTRVRSEGSPLMTDADVTSAIRVVAGEPQKRVDPQRPMPEKKTEEEPKPKAPLKNEDEL